MPSDPFATASPASAHARDTGALLLCRAAPATVGPDARLLRERMLLAPAGREWSVLVPEDGPWARGGEPLERVLGGWAAALAVGASWPVLALWWDADRGGYSLASGFRRAVGYVWLADGTPAGEDEAMRTFGARLGLDPERDVPALEALTRRTPGADAGARMRGLIEVLTRAGLALPSGLAPGVPADRLRSAVLAQPETVRIEWSPGRGAARTGPTPEHARGEDVDAGEEPAREHPCHAEPDGTGAVRGQGAGAHGGHGGRAPDRYSPWCAGPGRALALAQLATGVPLLLWGLRRRSGGWVTAGALLVGHGALGLARCGRRPG